jgi:hypothetical protein
VNALIRLFAWFEEVGRRRGQAALTRLSCGFDDDQDEADLNAALEHLRRTR